MIRSGLMCVKMHIVNEDSPCYVTPFAPEEVAASRVGREKKLGRFFKGEKDDALSFVCFKYYYLREKGINKRSCLKQRPVTIY